MNGFDGDRLIGDLATASTPATRFKVLIAGLAALGLDTINYGYFEAGSTTDIQFLTTMSDDWMSFYVDRDLETTDSHVVRIQARKVTPYIWDENAIKRVESKAERNTALQAAEAGLRSALCVPLASPHDPFTPVGGITFGTSRSADVQAAMSEHGASLVSIAYLFHNSCIRQLWHERQGGQSLSPRERDCLRYIADGKRQDAIAHIMGVARVTIEMHLGTARRKLGAQTLNEAIAKALILGEISRD